MNGTRLVESWHSAGKVFARTFLLTVMLFAPFNMLDRQPGFPSQPGLQGETGEFAVLEGAQLLETPTQTQQATAIGHVWYDGTAVSGAQVTLLAPDGNYISATTQVGPLSGDPYFYVDFEAAPLHAASGDLFTMVFSYQGEENSLSFLVQDGEQTLNGYLSSTCGPTEVSSGLIGVNTNWVPECGPYIVTQNLHLLAEKILTIEPGTRVEFAPARMLWADGTLNAAGMPEAMITFTARDDAVPGAWGYLHLKVSSLFSYVLVEYGGGLDVVNNAALRFEGGIADVQDSFVRDSASDGLQIYSDAEVRLNGMTIMDNAGWGVYIDSLADGLGVYSSTIQANADGGIRAYRTDTITITNNLIADNLGSGVDVYSNTDPVLVSENILRGNQSANGAGIYFERSAHGKITRNHILENTATTSGGGIRRGHSSTSGKQVVVNRNFILSNHADSDGGGMWIDSNYEFVSAFRNIIAENTSQRRGGGIYDYVKELNTQFNAFIHNFAAENGSAYYGNASLPIFQRNVVIANTTGPGGGAVYLGKKPEEPVNYNSMYSNQDYTLFYAAEDTAENLLDAKGNWWGSVNPAAIPPQIWDKSDDGALAEVDFVPWLVEPYSDAPLNPPTGVTAITKGSTITLTWESNVEPDLAGYKLYFDDSDSLAIDAALGEVSGLDAGLVSGAVIKNVPVGIYALAVTAYDAELDGIDDWTDCNESWLSAIQTVQIGESPHASFTAAPTGGLAPLTVAFTDTSSGDFSSWLWDFGDGDSSTIQNPAHEFVSAGTYTVSLTIDGPLGSDTLIKSSYISIVSSGEAPVSDFTAVPTSGIAPLEVSFTDISTGSIDSWSWDFGDGGGSALQHPTYTYETAGVYTVTLQVSGALGSDSEVKSAYINAGSGAVVADFSAAPTSGDFPLVVHFQDLSSGDITDWVWDFGDGSGSGDQNPMHTYDLPGEYDVSLNVLGTAGSDTLSRSGYIRVSSARSVFLPLVCP